MKTVYIESTVVSYCTARRTRDLIAAAHQEITSEWWEEALPSFEPYVSQIVFDEISRGDTKAAQRRLEMKDAIVEQTRQIRMQIEQEFDHDAQKYLEHVYEAQKQHGGRLVRRRPKPLRKRKVV